ncbi:hexosaminidase D-like isoform X2 [Diorhabda carinulata]|uniref:hexosaminidase D-like isoform X2 n=1 Tax=Diorhabda carinulata TaxID=1163345 RepID=UPI0025A1AA5E|nr:hexosaminidase D-like isoform X2 [Diorhabda carinulata]
MKLTKFYTVFIVFIVFISVFYFLFYLKWDTRQIKNKIKIQWTEDMIKPEINEQNSRFSMIGEKIVHIDLKGAPPKISFYKYLLPLLAKFGATGILLEYEDMFPYSGDLVNISARNAYTLDDIKEINKLAAEQNLKIIPLIQMFGHLEFILKLNSYEDLREVPEYPQVICPTNEKTVKLLEVMVEQVIRSHNNIQYIHIGADEVFYLGVCDRCTDFMMKNNLSKNLLYAQYIKKIVGIIKRLYPNITVLMWDDQFRSFTNRDFSFSNISNYIEPVIWKYTKDVYDELGPSLWNSYEKHFKNVWIASAFKGATGSNEVLPATTHYLQNHHSWMSVVAEYSNQINFQGIIITGWQRYDHFAILCELLPLGLPILAMSLRIVLGYNDSPLSPPTEIANLLKCKQPYALIGPAFGSPKCTFPGGEIIENIIRFQQLKQEFESIIENSKVKGWMTDYNVNHCFTNIYFVETVTTPLGKIKQDLFEVKALLEVSLSDIYDEFTVNEWIETYVKPLDRQVNNLWDAKMKLSSKKNWDRRPFVKETCR